MREHGVFIFLLRPDGTSVWLPEAMAVELGASHGQRLSLDQFERPCVQELLAMRRRNEGGGKKI